MKNITLSLLLLLLIGCKHELSQKDFVGSYYFLIPVEKSKDNYFAPPAFKGITTTLYPSIEYYDTQSVNLELFMGSNAIEGTVEIGDDSKAINLDVSKPRIHADTLKFEMVFTKWGTPKYYHAYLIKRENESILGISLSPISKFTSEIVNGLPNLQNIDDDFYFVSSIDKSSEDSCRIGLLRHQIKIRDTTIFENQYFVKFLNNEIRKIQRSRE